MDWQPLLSRRHLPLENIVLNDTDTLMTRVPSFLIVSFVLVSAAYASDVYVVDAYALAAKIPNSCTSLVWDADTVFYNLSNTDAVVTLLGISNGTRNPGFPNTFTIPAGTATSIRQKIGALWHPLSNDAVWVYHLDVPDGVRVDTELFPESTTLFCPRPVIVTQPYGKVQIPVFRTLTPAGQSQFIGGLTLGDVPAHMNVAIYNAGETTAHATIQVFRACDARLVASQQVTIPANTIWQFPAVPAPNTTGACASGIMQPNGLNSLAYAAVVVDSPSLSFASAASDIEPPISTILFSAGH